MRVLIREGAPWWVAADVCRVLEIANPRDAVSSLDEDEKMTVANSDGQAGRGAQSYNLISESGLYALIFKSRKPQAKAFRKWVTAEVLPAIRMTGGYDLGVSEEAELPELPAPPRLLGLDQLVMPVTFPEYFQNHRPLGLDMTMAQMVTFGTRVARAAKAFGVPYVQKPFAGYGMLRAYPLTLCNIVGRTMQRPPTMKDQDDEDFSRLVEMMGVGTYPSADLMKEAVDAGFFAEWLTRFTMMEPSARIRFGVITKRHDRGEFGPFRVRRTGSKNKVKIIIEEVA